MMDFGYSGQKVNAGPDFIVAETFDHCFHKGGAVAHHAFDKLNAAGRQHDKLLASVFGVFDHCDQVKGRLGQRTEGFRSDFSGDLFQLGILSTHLCDPLRRVADRPDFLLDRCNHRDRASSRDIGRQSGPRGVSARHSHRADLPVAHLGISAARTGKSTAHLLQEDAAQGELPLRG